MRDKLRKLIASKPELLVNLNTSIPKLFKFTDYLIENGVTIRPHGEWVDHCVRDWRCSECGEKINKVRKVDGYCYDDKPNYCPNCGADMRERKES